MNNIKCVHHTDFDGLCSAAIVARAHPGTQFIPMDYGYPTPEVDAEDTVIMVDFHLQPFSKMLEMRKKVKNFIWIDHHKSAIEDEKKAGVSFIGIRKQGMGACALTWEYFMQTPLPEAVSLLSGYDIHDISEPVLCFQYGMRSFSQEECKPDSQLWEGLLTTDNSQSEESEVVRVMKRGIPVLSYVQSYNEDYARSHSFHTKFEGYNCLVANMGRSSSMLFDSVENVANYDVLITFVLNKERQWVVSMFAQKPEVDVSVVAVKYGGGGHKGAAGFTIKELPF